MTSAAVSDSVGQSSLSSTNENSLTQARSKQFRVSGDLSEYVRETEMVGDHDHKKLEVAELEAKLVSARKTLESKRKEAMDWKAKLQALKDECSETVPNFASLGK